MLLAARERLVFPLALWGVFDCLHRRHDRLCSYERYVCMQPVAATVQLGWIGSWAVRCTPHTTLPIGGGVPVIAV
mgnify:CR=1 FL=1